MDIEYISAEKITSVEVGLARKARYWIYAKHRPATKWIFGIVKDPEIEEGYYCSYNSRGFECAEDVVAFGSNSQNLMVKSTEPPETQLWEKAWVRIEKRNDESTVYFKTDQEAIDFAEEVSKKFDHIKIKHER